jgi:hypothetical protein
VKARRYDGLFEGGYRDEVLGLLNAKRRQPLNGDEDAINCRLALKTQLYVNGFFPKVMVV